VLPAPVSTSGSSIWGEREGAHHPYELDLTIFLTMSRSSWARIALYIRKLLRRTSENSVHAKFAEFPFQAFR
jgi:hypothetical protein